MDEHPGPDIAAARARLGISQRRLAKLASVSPTTLGRIERREITPHQHTLGKILKALEEQEAQPPRASDPDTSEHRVRLLAEWMHLAAEDPGDWIVDLLTSEAELSRMLQQRLRLVGLRPELPGPEEPDYDLAWSPPDEAQRMLVEIAHVTGSSEAIWRAMGQVLAYCEQIPEGPVQPLLFIDREPTTEEVRVLQRQGVLVGWPGAWDRIGLELDAPTDPTDTGDDDEASGDDRDRDDAGGMQQRS